MHDIFSNSSVYHLHGGNKYVWISASQTSIVQYQQSCWLINNFAQPLLRLQNHPEKGADFLPSLKASLSDPIYQLKRQKSPESKQSSFHSSKKSIEYIFRLPQAYRNNSIKININKIHTSAILRYVNVSRSLQWKPSWYEELSVWVW